LETKSRQGKTKAARSTSNWTDSEKSNRETGDALLYAEMKKQKGLPRDLGEWIKH
jgi:hypothetical protein